MTKTTISKLTKLLGNHVLVRWIDAEKQFTDGYGIKEICDRAVVSMILDTPGYLVKVTESFITLASEYNARDDLYRDRTDIPSSWIVEVLVPSKYRSIKA